jgi:hypothetical protein
MYDILVKSKNYLPVSTGVYSNEVFTYSVFPVGDSLITSDTAKKLADFRLADWRTYQIF